MGSVVYFIFALIDLFPFPPISGAKYPNDTGAIGEADGVNATANSAKAEVTRLARAVL
jgi:hypothetical protein